MARVKYFQLYESLYNVIKDLPAEEFKRALMPLLDYAFSNNPHEVDCDRFFESIFIQNVVFIEKLQQDIENGKKGGAPKGNKNAKGHGAPKGNTNAKKNKQPYTTDSEKNKQPDKEKEKETETDTDKETDTFSSEPSHTPLEGGARSDNESEEVLLPHIGTVDELPVDEDGNWIWPEDDY
jgi:hypothetical protein